MLLHEFIEIQNGRPWFYCLFSLVGIVVSLRMNKKKTRKKLNKLKLKSLHKTTLYHRSYQRLNPDNHFNYEKIL
jgi:hypothetical protein